MLLLGMTPQGVYLFMDHILSAGQFSKKLIDKILQGAGKMESALQKGNVPQKLAGKIVACLFFEPSTRTRLSFETAVLRLGGQQAVHGKIDGLAAED